jgi:hypothetical protein
MEAYSEQMLAAVRHDVQQASVCQLLELARYFRQRKGPGLGLVTEEIKAHQARRRLNYPPK